MRKQDIRILFISFRILPGLRSTGIPSVYCSNSARLRKLIKKNKQYRINVICKAKHAKKLHSIITGRCIHEIFILGDIPRHNIKNKEVTMINNNERDMIFHILCATVRYTHDEEIIQRKLENYGLADALTMDILKLLDQIASYL